MRPPSQEMVASTHSNPSSCPGKIDVEMIRGPAILDDPLEESFASMSVAGDDNGTQAVFLAATHIQRIMRGCLQRWKFLIAKNESELLRIKSLHSKQVKKIGERKQKTLQWHKKRQQMDSSSSERRLARAKKAIKFLMKEEKRQKKENVELRRPITQLESENQTLVKAKLSQREIDKLQMEVAGMEQQQLQLQFTARLYEESIAAARTEGNQLEAQIHKEQQHKEQLHQCVSRITEIAQSSLPPAAWKFFTLADGMRGLAIQTSPLSVPETMMQH